MVLDRQRSRLDWWLVPLARRMRGANPNAITWWSLAAALGAGVAFWQSGPDRLWLVALAAVLVWSNGVLDVLDGKIAKMTGRQTAKGDYLDHAFDRLADTAFIAGLGFSPWVRIEVAFAAIVFTLLTSYLGTQAQAVGMGRNYGGVLTRADRMILLIVVPWAHFGLELGNIGLPAWWTDWSPNVLDTLLIYFAAAGLVTTLQRLALGLRGFDRDGRVRP
jgi:archaetidylinositol phosphate synthase